MPQLNTFNARMINVKVIFYCMALLFFFSCLKVKEEKTKAAYYFDLKEFFEKEAARLQSENPVVRKTVVLNNDTESKERAIEDWNNEFLTFMEADINKSAFAGKYAADTVFADNRIEKITYRAQDKKLKTRWLEIDFDSLQNAEQISITIETKNTLYQSAQQLHYHKNQFYSVAGRQEIRLLSPDAFKVEVKF